MLPRAGKYAQHSMVGCCSKSIIREATNCIGGGNYLNADAVGCEDLLNVKPSARTSARPMANGFMCAVFRLLSRSWV